MFGQFRLDIAKDRINVQMVEIYGISQNLLFDISYSFIVRCCSILNYLPRILDSCLITCVCTLQPISKHVYSRQYRKGK